MTVRKQNSKKISSQAYKTRPPQKSKIIPLLENAYFYDAWSVTAADPSLSPMQQLISILDRTPQWVNSCMTLRNRVVRLFGLKDLGRFNRLNTSKSDSDYQAMDRVGIFTLFEKDKDEVLFGDQDKHLNVTLSLYKEPGAEEGKSLITVTTVVHVNNLLGKLYLIPVLPMHRIIAPSVLKSLAR